ncbi:MAG: DUF4396 domain-containing protein [Terriglobales bacterium]
MMQIGMIVGFLTSYPINFLLIRIGWKEKMPADKSEKTIPKRAPGSWRLLSHPGAPIL